MDGARRRSRSAGGGGVRWRIPRRGAVGAGPVELDGSGRDSCACICSRSIGQCLRELEAESARICSAHGNDHRPPPWFPRRLLHGHILPAILLEPPVALPVLFQILLVHCQLDKVLADLLEQERKEGVARCLKLLCGQGGVSAGLEPTDMGSHSTHIVPLYSSARLRLPVPLCEPDLDRHARLPHESPEGSDGALSSLHGGGLSSDPGPARTLASGDFPTRRLARAWV